MLLNLALDSDDLLTIRRHAVSNAADTRTPGGVIPAIRLGRVWRVDLGVRRRTWTIAPGGDVDRADALAIRHRVYEERFGNAWPVEEDAIDARAFLCVVRLPDGRPVASLRLIGADDRPLELDPMLPLPALLGADARPGELNRFAILRECRGMSTGVHMALFQWSFALARRDQYTHFLVLAPHDVRPIYEFLLFHPVSTQRFHHPWIPAGPCTPMALELRDVGARYQAARHAFAPLLDRQDALAPELRIG